MRRVCLDSNIVIWGIKKKASVEQGDMIQWAMDFLEWIEIEKIEPVIPELVVAEILSSETPEERIRLRDYLEANYVIAPFDSLAVDKFAELMFEHFKDARNRTKDEDIRKDKMKFDFAIAATAVQNNCECIYSHDKPMANACKAFIEVREMPRISLPGVPLALIFTDPTNPQLDTE